MALDWPSLLSKFLIHYSHLSIIIIQLSNILITINPVNPPSKSSMSMKQAYSHSCAAMQNKSNPSLGIRKVNTWLPLILKARYLSGKRKRMGRLLVLNSLKSSCMLVRLGRSILSSSSSP